MSSHRDTDGIGRDELVRDLDGYLDIATGRDYCPNGLQVEGRESIRKIVTGVSACRELFVRAREMSAEGRSGAFLPPGPDVHPVSLP